jgi:hypothetical protein
MKYIPFFSISDRLEKFSRRSVIAAALFATALPAFAAKPNILVILADDLGYNDVGFQDSPDIPTPNLNALADSGCSALKAMSPARCVRPVALDF